MAPQAVESQQAVERPQAVEVAETIAALDARAFDPAMRAKAKACLLDFLGCAFEATALDPSRQAMAAVFEAPGGHIIGETATATPADAAFVFGDFNEPSHHDWVDATVKAGLQPLVVPYPTEKAIEARGFVDTFRAVYPDPVAKPGLTWTPTTSPSDKDDHHDRIDFALAKAEKLEVLSAGILGEKAPEADIVVTPWPSDHRATFAKVRF